MVLPAPESPVSQTVNPGSGCGRVTVGEYSRGSAILFRMKRAVVRRADPYRDTEVIDERAPRVNQAVVGTVALVAVVTGWWLLPVLLALQLALGLTLGRRWCLACVFYFEVLQPRLGEGPLEDSRPPRFANMVGLGFLGAYFLLIAEISMATHARGKFKMAFMKVGPTELRIKIGRAHV